MPLTRCSPCPPQEIGCEKTLVCAAQGLSTPPEGRGDFDQMAINCIKEELLEKMQQVPTRSAHTHKWEIWIPACFTAWKSR